MIDVKIIGEWMKCFCDCNMFVEIECMVVCFFNILEYNENEDIK